MSEIAELERRITAALDRIGTGVDGLAEAAANSDEITALNEALEAERVANAQLEERVSAIKQKQDTSIKEMETRIESLSADLAKQEVGAKRLLKVNAQLRETNGALEATRKADLGELEAIMDELKPLIGEGA